MTDPDTVNATRLDDADALLWAVERDPRLASTISSIVVFDSLVDPDALRVRLERATRVVLRMRQRVVGNPASLSPPRWEVDPDYSIDNHLCVIDCPGDATIRDALDTATPFIAEPFDRAQPLFSVMLIQAIDGDRSAMVMKAHHAIADGMGMLQIQAELFDFEPDTDDPDMPEIVQVEPLTPGERLGNAVDFERTRAVQALRDLGSALVLNLTAGQGDAFDNALDTLASALRSVVPVSPMSPLLTERSSESWHHTMAVPLADLKQAGARAGTRMNAAFVAGVARGMGLFHERAAGGDGPQGVGQRCDLLRMGMPISIRTSGDEAGTGNHIIPIRLQVPLNAEHPDHLIEIAEALIDTQRNDPAQTIIGPSQQLLARLPSSLSGMAFAQVLRGSDFLTSNLPGSPVPMWLGSARIEAQFPFGPTSAAAVNVTLLSYLDTANIGISIDAAATDQRELLAACIREGLDWVIAG